MKKIIAIGSFLGALSCFILFGIATISCNKPTDCKGQVTVVDTVNQVISGVSVKLYGGQVSTTAITNTNGIANFDIKLPAILSISARGTVLDAKGATDSVIGTGTIQLQAGQTGYATVIAKLP